MFVNHGWRPQQVDDLPDREKVLMTQFALKEIRAKDGNAKVIMCSAMGQEGMVVDAVKSGARDFIVKPFKPDRIVQAVNKVLGAP